MELEEAMQAGYGLERHREWKSCCGKKRKKRNMEDRTTEDLPRGPRNSPPARAEMKA